ncbi:MAG TPA: hypothetical protein VG147_05775 [Solirubrobacteraceae bacterium]|jgi:hypothetical protein|nr:hypothetical protein [Solirubrobacteraceae bacterium]
MTVRTGISLALLAVLGTAAAAACAVSAGAGAATHRAPQRHPRIYVANKDCRGHTFRPASITLACGDGDLYVSEVDYFNSRSEGYGSARAGASVTIHENDCKPDCAAGRFIVEKGGLTLKRIVRCADGLLYYSRALYAFPGGENEVDIQPFERCSPVHRVHAAAVPANAPDVPAEPPASPSVRALIAARSVQRALKAAALPKGATRLRRVPAGQAKLLGSIRTPAASLGTEERAKLVARSSVWATSAPPSRVFAYVAAHLPTGTREVFSTSGDSSFTPPHGHESLPEIEKRESVNFWGEEFRLPRGSRALRLCALGVYIARRGASTDRFIVRVTAAASWERARPSYSLLGANVGAVTITVTDRPSRKREPPPVIIRKPALVRTIVQDVNELPVDESAGSAVNCPAEGIGRTSQLLSLSFSEGEHGPLLATFTDNPEACVPEPSIALPGEPPIALSEVEGLVRQIERVSTIRLR